MPSPKGVKHPQRRAHNLNGGRPKAATYAERFAAEPEGSSVIRLPNRTLAGLEERAEADGVTIPEAVAAYIDAPKGKPGRPAKEQQP